MNLLITGGTGFIGSALISSLMKDNHRVVVLTRTAPVSTAFVSLEDLGLIEIHSLSQLSALERFDAVINLAGEPIANKRWSRAQRDKIVASRINTTQQLIDFFSTLEHKPLTFISGSAVGVYGLGVESNPINEQCAGDDSFASQLCQQWEQTALQAKALSIRTCLLRTGIVLGQQGALAKMLLPFKLGLGGVIGHGAQWMPWVHIDDMVGIIRCLIEHQEIEGAVNATAPTPATNREFTQSLGRAVNRPTWFTMPAFMIKLLMGQMGEELLLSGKRVIPEKLINAGYQFKYQQLDNALGSIIER
ncbi:TIGR01777 family oxidoreductase [Psychrobium sp. 1_MG-2023]|uniref:TIGR01777 family oxidoreductase n=1 Tax=Psychrobium sp. 1_MG-2023 TaxID=3062624 RepID=UPI000C32B000|nr:TIGR01777 family oxidoreductase [Psychrobium sp. 1_MG-2023]MDP2561771.1 TIGR01777 family oxidoreductase [Psychrobium sp. 1_MG-2023]PKF59745.1 TIGR01777 family protein [Alteromonadales bacterium alter-6D02]